MSASFTPGPWLVHTTNRIVVQADGAFASVTVKDGKVTGDVLPNSICRPRLSPVPPMSAQRASGEADRSPSPIKVGLRDWRGLLVGCCFIVLVWAMLGVTP